MAKKAIKEVDTHVGALICEPKVALGMSQQSLGEAMALRFGIKVSVSLS